MKYSRSFVLLPIITLLGIVQTIDSIVFPRAYITAHEVYKLYINGQRVGRELFTPEWTSCHKRLRYQTYDITTYLQTGNNSVGVYLGEGWFRGFMGRHDQRNFYGETLALLVQIEITKNNGSRQTVFTDNTWKSLTGQNLWSDIYNGEFYYARLEKKGWTISGYDDSNWKFNNIKEF